MTGRQQIKLWSNTLCPDFGSDGPRSLVRHLEAANFHVQLEACHHDPMA